MTYRKLTFARRVSVLVLCAMSGLLTTGCTTAIFDAVASGALNFIQTGVTTALSSFVFGEDGIISASTVMGGMTSSTGGDHDGHGG